MIENVHDDEGKVDDHEDADQLPLHPHGDRDHAQLAIIVLNRHSLHGPASDHILTTLGLKLNEEANCISRLKKLS